MTVREMIIKCLKEGGYDGLCVFDDCVDGICDCGIDDLVPCGEIPMSCEAAYKYSDGSWSTDKPEETTDAEKED